MKDSSTIQFAPNGNGGMYPSMKTTGVLDHIQSLGIEYLHICGIDNILVKLADPLMFGTMQKHKLDGVSKFSAKAFPLERVGVHAKLNGQYYVIEYSVIGDELAQKTSSDGELLYNNAFILSYVLRVDFLANQVLSEENAKLLASRYHFAIKSVDSYSSKTNSTNKIEGIKFEIFCMEAFKFLENEKFGLIKINRSQEFAPIKNKTGSAVDTPESALKLYSDYHKSLLEKNNIYKEGESIVSIHPNDSYDGEGLGELSSYSVLNN